MPHHSLVYRTILLGHFLKWGSLCSDGPSLCQDDRKKVFCAVTLTVLVNKAFNESELFLVHFRKHLGLHLAHGMRYSRREDWLGQADKVCLDITHYQHRSHFRMFCSSQNSGNFFIQCHFFTERSLSPISFPQYLPSLYFSHFVSFKL